MVDEQLRCGVRRRLALSGGASEAGGRRHSGRSSSHDASSTAAPDVLVMSATPIPRSLALALYGDLDLSILDEIPAGRTPIETRLHFPNERAAVYARVEEELVRGHQGYIVYPLVEESDRIELRAAAQEQERLSREVFPHRRVGLLHGQMAADEKDAVMQAFRRGELDLLVATTIVEVGIDVPNATVMVIEHAERFGLSQLHQLRGRVGRGSAPSLCILIAEGGKATLERLRVFRNTLDGFKIARADLMIRGQGDLFGSQQHGKDPLLRFADLGRDEDLLEAAREMAREIIAEDPALESPKHARIRELLAWRHGDRLKMWKVG
jgi:ATP-dependent DNA helicase RecG